MLAISLVGLVMGATSASAAGILPTPPPSPITVGYATISNVSINGTIDTLAVVPSGSQVSLTATVNDSHPKYCPGCIDYVQVGFVGQSSPIGCIEQGGSTGSTQTNTVDFTAPTVPGIYNIVANPNFVYYCGQDWGDGSSGTTIATLIVTGTSGQLCRLITAWSTNRDVASGLCDKLAAAQDASDAGHTRVVNNVMKAFNHQLMAQRGKALTADQVNTIQVLAHYLF